MKTDFLHFKELLEKEKSNLKEELSKLGNEVGKDDWEATAANTKDEASADESGSEPDPSDMSDRIEEYEERFGVEDTLEKRYREVEKALEAIEKGTYGFCTAGGELHTIEVERLEANPAAATCIKHE